MKKIYFFTTALLLTFGSWASAQETVTCINGDCLTYGYEKRDADNIFFEVGECTGSDCDFYGWTIYLLTGESYAVVCAENSCYSKGFQEIDTTTNTIRRTRTCQDNGTGGDCFANGWRDEYADSTIERVRPTDGLDIRNGFIVETIIDSTASYQQQIANTEALIDSKDAELKAFLKANKRMNHVLLAEIIDLRQELQRLKKDLKVNGGVQVVDSQEAVCLAPGACYTQGYVLQ